MAIILPAKAATAPFRRQEAADRRNFRAVIRGWSDKELGDIADRYCCALLECAPERQKFYRVRLRMIDHELVSRTHSRHRRRTKNFSGRTEYPAPTERYT